MPTVIADPQPPLEEMWPFYFDMLKMSGCLSPNWDGNGAIALSDVVIETSKQFMTAALKDDLPLDEVQPMPNGTIKFVFKSDDIDEACIEINETTNISDSIQTLKGVFGL